MNVVQGHVEIIERRNEEENFKKVKNLTCKFDIFDFCILCSHKHNFKSALSHFTVSDLMFRRSFE